MDEITAHPVTMGRMAAGGIPGDQRKGGSLWLPPSLMDSLSGEERKLIPYSED
jgi:hypothetical protein